MDTRIQAAFSYIDAQEEDMKKLYRNLVRIESPSSDKEALEKIAAHLDTYCDALGMGRETYHYEKSGPTFAAWTKPGRLAPIALIGHIDTVHPVGSFGEEAFRVEGDKVYGPGCYDMKGGDVIMLYAIKALQRIGYEDRQIKLLISGDEEVAHAFSEGESGHMIEQHVDGCAAAFNCESGAPGEEVTTRRKGGAVFVIKVYGKAAHAGKEPEKGASAILQAARMIAEIESHTVIGDMTFNCGTIKGGSGSNIIPDFCQFTIGVRYCTNEQYEWASHMIEELCNHVTVPGTSCTMEQNGFYPAMELTEKTGRLLSVYQDACRLLDRPIPQGLFQGGCSDSSYATRIGVPTLCSLGIQGNNAHQRSEYADLSSMTLQCKKLVASILMLPDDF